MRGAAILTMGMVAVGAVTLVPRVAAQAGIGQIYFERYCVTCHGAAGKGDGNMAKSLRVRPADLTRLAVQNNGTFPEERVKKSIDGRARTGAPPHTDMPVWAEMFAKMSDSQGPEDVESRIVALVKYVETIQQKP